MYDHNPFRDAKKIFEEEKSDFMKNLQFVMDPIHAQYGDQGSSNRESMRAAIIAKRKHHEELVRKGELTQDEFDRLEKQGEFDIKEAKKFDSMEHCIDFYMDVKEMSKEDARRACMHRKDDINEEEDYERLSQMDPREPFGKSEEDYEAEQQHNDDRERHHSAIDHIRRFITTKGGGSKMMKDLHAAESNRYELDPNLSVVRAGDMTYTVDHKTGDVKVVS